MFRGLPRALIAALALSLAACGASSHHDAARHVDRVSTTDRADATTSSRAAPRRHTKRHASTTTDGVSSTTGAPTQRFDARHTTAPTSSATTAAPSPTAPITTTPPSGGGGPGGALAAGVYCGGWIHRQTPNSHMRVHDATGGRAPSATDCANARAFYDRVLAANAKYADINVAIANNYKPGHDAPGSPATHYVFWGDTGLMDPNQPQGLMYKFDPVTHHATWLGVMFVERSYPLPQPAGSLTVWHDHGIGQPYMFHVWTFAGAADPFALMLPDAVGR